MDGKMIINLWSAIKRLKSAKHNASVADLYKELPDIEKILFEMQQFNVLDFDLKLTFLDSQNYNPLFSTPGDRGDFFGVVGEQIALSSFENLITGDKKVSELLSDVSSLDLSSDSVIATANQASASWNTQKERIGYNTAKPIRPINYDSIRSCLMRNHIVWCANQSCSGKTWLGIRVLDDVCKQGCCFVSNLGSNQLLGIDSLYCILEFGYNCGIMIDDLQCNTDISHNLLDYIKNNRRSLIERNVYIYLISWASLPHDKDFRQYSEERIFSFVSVQPKRLLRSLKDKVSNKNVLRICGNNLSLLSRATVINSEEDISAAKKILFECFINNKADEEQINLAYICLVLGSYGFEVPESFLNTYGEVEHDTILSAKSFEHTIYVEHREVCKFLAEYIESELRDSIRLTMTSREIIKKYIEFLDSSEKWRAVMQLAVSDEKSRKSDVCQLGFAWNLLTDLVEFLKGKSIEDPSWGNTPSSMYFVMQIGEYFFNVTNHPEFRRVVDSFVKSFYLDNGHVKFKPERLTTTKDFNLIKERMIEEDLNMPPCGKYESGENIDIQVAHLNWLLSFIVGANRILTRYGYSDLVEAAKNDLLKSQLPDGSWYPTRIPWITGCVIRGLSYCDDRYNDDDLQNSIDRAADFLLSIVESNQFWRAHTGSWNSIYETTSICLEGLYKCDVITSGSDSRIAGVINYLQEHSDEWTSPKSEIDGTAVACILMYLCGLQDDENDDYLLKYIKGLAQRKVDILSVPESEDFVTESCVVPLICFYIVELCLNMLEQDLDVLMDDFMKEANVPDSDISSGNNLSPPKNSPLDVNLVY